MESLQPSVNEVAPDIYRISVPVPPSVIPGGFSFNQYLIRDVEPVLFHTGPRKMFPLVREQLEKVLPLSQLRWIAFSHYEADECGALAEFLGASQQARPVCSRIAAMVSVADAVDVEPHGMDDGDTLETGKHRLRWQSTPHLPHGWECGYLFDETTRTLFCGDLFTQPGTGGKPLTSDDILGPSEALRQQLDYFSHSRHAPALLEKLSSLQPRTLACMHGSAWTGDGANLLRQLGAALAQ